MNLDQLKAKCNEVGDCWEWITTARSVARKRHPMTKLDGKPVLLRRHAYELVHGEMDAGRYLVPHCGNACCINPEHQQVLSERQKNKLGGKRAAKSPTRAGSVAVAKRAQSTTKLSMEIAQAIRASDDPCDIEAAKHGVHPSRVTQIRRGQGWKDYSNPFSGLGARA